MHRYFVLFLASWVLSAQTDTEWLNRGVQAFKNAQYGDAVNAFQHAVDGNPGNVTARLYLGTAYMQQYIPGAAAPENEAQADRAMAEFQKVLDMDPANKVAIMSLASLELNRKRYDQSRNWYKKLLVIDPSNREAYYSIGFTIWAQWYPAYGAARQKLGMRQDMPGPIPDIAVRNSLRAQWWTALDEGIANLKHALELDPSYADAMAYLNLFIRERADLMDTRSDYDGEVHEADLWVQRALDAKRRQTATSGGMLSAPPPPPPPPPPPGSASAAPQRIKIGGNVQASKLLNRVNPVYPALAREAKIEGVVKLGAVIGKDGYIQQLQVTSGHPLLVPAALEAVKQWQYQTTLLNGQPVEVFTDIDVVFALVN